jgi:hypothetical protein
VFVSERRQAVVRISTTPDGPPLSNHALCAIIDVARSNDRELPSARAVASSDNSAYAAFVASELQSKGEGARCWTYLVFFTRPAFGFAADHDLIFSFGVILFAGVDGLLHILQALGARADFDGLGFCQGFSISNPVAIETALGCGVPATALALRNLAREFVLRSVFISGVGRRGQAPPQLTDRALTVRARRARPGPGRGTGNLNLCVLVVLVQLEVECSG